MGGSLMNQRFSFGRAPAWNPYIIDGNVLNEQHDFFPAGYEFFQRKVRFYEIQFITGEKAGKLIIDGQHYKPRKGDLFFRKPGMKLQGVAGFYSYNVCFDPVYDESRQHCYHSNIPFWASDENTMLPDGGYFDDLPIKYNTNRFNELEPLFSGIIQAFSDDRQTNQPRMKGALLLILKIIFEELDDTRARANPSMALENQTTKQYYERIMVSKQFIDQHLDHKLSLDTLAHGFGSSPGFFSRIFKKIIGITPFEYIIESRLILARHLLTTSGMSIEQVASACGFDNISYFYRIFKRRFQITPALLSEGYRRHAEESDEEKAESNPDAPDNFSGEGDLPADCYPPGKMPDNEPNFLSGYPYIIDYTYNNQPNFMFPVGVKMVPRMVRFYEIELIIGGAGKEITDGKHFNASRGDIFFRKPGMVCQGISGYYFYEIAFDPVFNESRRYCYDSPITFYLSDHATILPNKDFFPHFPYKYRTNRLSKLEPLFRSIVQSFPKRKDDLPLYIRTNLLKILNMVHEELNTTRTVTFEDETVKHNYEKIMICKQLIDDHPDQKFSLEMLAEVSGLSQNFFSKIFKQIIGSSPLEYITETRIQLAKSLLATSVLSIQEISSRTGFDDVTYFYRIFKRHTNMTPNAFRHRFAVSSTK